MAITNPNDVRFQDVGFDISHNNGDLDFQALWDAGRRVCWAKITEGTDFRDPRFESYMSEILALGTNAAFNLAVYNFAHETDPEGQVHFVMDTLADAEAKIGQKLPVLFMIDAERGNNPPTALTVYSMVDEFRVEGVPNPMVYCGYDFFPTKAGIFAPCSHMLAEYGTHPYSAVPWRRPDSVFGWDWWQYTGDALGPWAKDIAGGSDGMDLSCFNLEKNPAGFSEWWKAELAKTHG